MMTTENLVRARLMMPKATTASVEILASSGLIEMLAACPLPANVERSKSGPAHHDVTGYFQRSGKNRRHERQRS